MVALELNRIIDQVAKDKGVPREVLIEAIESAMLGAARKKLGYEGELEAHFNADYGEVELFQFKTVAETVTDPHREMSTERAHALDPDAQIGDVLGEKVDASILGRIAAQTAKQVIIQKIRDAEREIVYQEYKDRVGEVITGVVRRIEKGNIIVDLGRTEGLLPLRHQVPTEKYKLGDSIQAYFLELQRGNLHGSQIILSRRTPDFVITLFKMEVPEIAEGIVEIKGCSREPGFRSKIAVYSRDSDVDPVGACVGMRGSRVQSVVQELRGEKIDIVLFEEDPARFICNAIAPAQVAKVIVREHEHAMEVVVPDDQLSLAIGKKGQNVRLAAQLVGWNIDVMSESHVEEVSKAAKNKMVEVLGIDESMSSILYNHMYRGIQDIAKTKLEDFIALPGMGKDYLTTLHEKARAYIAREQADKLQAGRATTMPAEETVAAAEAEKAGE